MACASASMWANAVLSEPIDAGKSKVTAAFKQMGVTVEAPFKKVSGQVDFDPSDATKSSARITIDIGSFDLGDPQYNKEVLKPEWFDAARHPSANFTSTSIAPSGANAFVADGKLTIKGKTLDVKMPVTVKNDAGMRSFEGRLPIKRLAYGIGEGEWKDTSLVADEVVIAFKLATPVVPGKK